MESQKYDEIAIVKLFQEMPDRVFAKTMERIAELPDAFLRERLIHLSEITYAI